MYILNAFMAFGQLDKNFHINEDEDDARPTWASGSSEPDDLPRGQDPRTRAAGGGDLDTCAFALRDRWRGRVSGCLEVDNFWKHTSI